jgi:hypothetical protein
LTYAAHPFYPLKTYLRFADAITPGKDGRLYFVEPAVDKMTMTDLIGRLGQCKEAQKAIT